MKTRQFFANLDYETSDRTGAGGCFQVISLHEALPGEEPDQTHLIDQGKHYYTLQELRSDLASKLWTSFEHTLVAESRMREGGSD